VVAAIATCWGSIGVIVRVLALPAVAIVASRCILATGTLALVFAVRRHRGHRGTPLRTRPALLVLLGVLLAGHWMALVAAQQRAPIGTVLLITYLAPVLVTALARPLLGELVPSRTFGALAVALAGTLLLVHPGVGHATGVLLAVVAAISYAFITLLSKLVVADVGGMRLAFIQLAVASAVLVGPAIAVSWGPVRAVWLWLLVLGVVYTALLGSLYLTMLDLLPVATVGILTYLEPVSAVLCAWLFLGEVPTVVTVVGGMLIVTAGVMVVRAGRSSPAAVVGSGHHVPG
jgi:drug/metabolite transporter (DMT)-like permease